MHTYTYELAIRLLKRYDYQQILTMAAKVGITSLCLFVLAAVLPHTSGAIKNCKYDIYIYLDILVAISKFE